VKHFWEQLKPGERRWVAAIGLIFFLVLNWLFIWPHFSDWGKANVRMSKAHDLIDRYNAELKNKPSYEAKIKALQSDGGSDVQAEEQAIDLIRFYNSRASTYDVQVINNSRPITRTNDPFFVDHEMQLNVIGRENHIVNFLYSLGAGNSIVRVRALSLRPDAAHQQINANISIVASYAKKPPARVSAAAPAPAKTAAPAPVAAAKPPAQTNKPVVAVNHNNATSNKPVPLTAKRP
jgi:hypothetical protein